MKKRQGLRFYRALINKTASIVESMVVPANIFLYFLSLWTIRIVRK